MKAIALKKLSQGFTLIELLVVIAILGVLAAALIAAIDPIEQIRKSQDSSYESVATEFNTALQRYYTTNGFYPWDAAANNPTPCTDPGAAGVKLGALQTCVNILLAQGELKASFNNAMNQPVATGTTNEVWVARDATDSTSSACFLPASKAVAANSNSVFNADGSAGAGCKATGGATVCRWCSK